MALYAGMGLCRPQPTVILRQPTLELQTSTSNSTRSVSTWQMAPRDDNRIYTIIILNSHCYAIIMPYSLLRFTRSTTVDQQQGAWSSVHVLCGVQHLKHMPLPFNTCATVRWRALAQMREVERKADVRRTRKIVRFCRTIFVVRESWTGLHSTRPFKVLLADEANYYVTGPFFHNKHVLQFCSSSICADRLHDSHKTQRPMKQKSHNYNRVLRTVALIY